MENEEELGNLRRLLASLKREPGAPKMTITVSGNDVTADHAAWLERDIAHLETVLARRPASYKKNNTSDPE